MTSALADVGLVARRSLRRTFRQPAFVVPPLLFPIILLAVNASGLDAAKHIPGFPADSYLDFALTVTFMQGALFASMTAGTELANDIQSGFLNRLQLTPLRAWAILAGQLAGALTMALVGTVVYIVVGVVAGASLEAGLAGAVVLVVLALLVALGFGALGMLIAARTGQAEAVQSLFPLMFVALFLSSMNLPRNLIEIDWFRTVATWNPISYLVEGMRSLIITGWDGTALWRGFAIGIALAAVGLGLSAAGLRSRMERT
jgi:ABC-2 type transport system permease protein